jgi:AcrR family transcriptional regulator
MYGENIRPPFASVNTVLYGARMIERLSAQDWIDFAIETLLHEGYDALKADVLARKLGVSRGSFYWHFKDINVFHANVIAHWRQASTESIIVDIERHPLAQERLEALLRRAFGRGAPLEIRVRTWGETNAHAARAIGETDRRRRDYIEHLLREAGVAAALASARAQLVYWAYLGAALSHGRLSGERLDRLVDELKRIALGK